MNRRNKTIAARTRRIHAVAFALLAVIAVIFLPAILGAFIAAPGVALASVGLFGFGRILLKSDTEGGGGSDTALLDKIEKGIETIGEETKAVRTKTDQLVSDYSRLDATTKKAFDDLTQLKKVANDTDAGMKAFMQKMQSIEGLMRREQFAAFGNPIERISRDPVKRELFNALVRKSVLGKTGNLRNLSEAHQKALDTANTPGSTMMVNELLSDIYDTLASYGVWNTFAQRRVGTKTVQVPVKTARPTAAYVTTEGGAITQDTAKAGSTSNMTIATIAVLLNVSEELLADAEFDVTADVMDDFAQAVAYKMDWACLQADGGADSTDGGFTGIFGGGGTAAVSATGNVSVETTDYEDVVNCILAVDAAVLTRPSRWWIHPQIIARMLKIKDSNGRPIFLTANEAPTYGGIGSILGYPVTPSHAAPSANTTSSKIAVFGDPNGLVHAVRKDFEFASSNQAAFSDYEVVFRGIARHGVKVRRATAFGVLTNAAS
jgi:HK97 family phage major capsid protein